MAEFYAYRVMSGKTTLNKAPISLRAKVAELLAAEGYADLIGAEDE